MGGSVTLLYFEIVQKLPYIIAEKMATVLLASSGGCFYCTEADNTLETFMLLRGAPLEQFFAVRKGSLSFLEIIVNCQNV